MGKRLVIINGPSINMLGIREPEIYGTQTYDELYRLIEVHAAEIGAEVDIFQSNSEGALIDCIQQAYFDGADGIVINPAGYTHTSIALRDALFAVGIPAVEVHVSAIENREAFRQISYVRDACVATISGHGIAGYTEAMDVLANLQEGEPCR